ncbi:MAG: pilus assembly protein [Gorillibacterium sp.]|nr:pilus assembly protein [Gorillibacterium sp.]
MMSWQYAAKAAKAIKAKAAKVKVVMVRTANAEVAKGSFPLRKLLHLVKREDGQLTLEATMVFPLILVLSFCMLFFSLYVYRSANLEFASEAAAESAASNWDNSQKDPLTGAYEPSGNDGLYWRTSSSEWSALFGLSGNRSSRLILPVEDSQAMSINQKKLARAAVRIPLDVKGELVYQNSFIERSVRVRLNQAGVAPSFYNSLMPSDRSTGAAVSYVTEPAEFIRNLELFVDYAGRLKSFLTKKDGGQAAFEQFSEEKPPPYIDSEAKAKKYIQEMVNGKLPDHLVTNPVGKWREYDAIDADGVAHDAKYTISKQEAFAQIAKDAELLRRGEIKGCVWHFFRYKKSNKQYLTPAIKSELERNGIIYVVHDL